MPQINAIDSSQKAILDILMEKPRTIRQIIMATGLSDTTVRQNLKVLTKLREVLMDKERQPYLYSINGESNTMQHRQKIDQVKRYLMGDGDPDNPFIKIVRSARKESYPDAAESMRLIATAIDELEMEGRLVDTL